MGAVDTTGSAASTPAVQKRPYRNNTLGWLGVVILDHTGKATGVSVEPQGVVWLSEAEAILTARAPRQAKDNPFEEQSFLVADETGTLRQQRMRPLVAIDDQRWVPQDDRYVPPAADAPKAVATSAAAEAALGTEPAHASGTGDPVARASEKIVSRARTAEEMIPINHAQPAVPDLSDHQPGNAGPQGTPQPANTPPGGQAPSQDPAVLPDGSEAQSWTEPPNGELRATGTLGGENLDEPEQATVVGGTGEETASEQTAGADGEETGASVTPSGDAVEGEFAQHEEPGNPDAAQQA